MTLAMPRVVTLEHSAHETGTLSPREQCLLWDMEERFWTDGADKARATTSADAIMIFPYPPGILQGEHIWSHLRRRTSWRTIEMAERRVTRCGDIAILTCRVSAEMSDVPILKALCASSYLHDGDIWVRIFHQQTPVT